jgi:hypothetical protein
MDGAVCMISIILILATIVVWTVVATRAKERRRRARAASIYAKYGHTDIAENIINRSIWVGESSEQLRDSLGSPVDIDEKVLKTKRKEVWKYVPRGASRYGLRITLDDDFVVGWDEKL